MTLKPRWGVAAWGLGGVAGREKAARARLAPSRGVPSNQTIETSGKRLLKRSNPAVGGGSSLRAPPAPSSGVTGWTERKTVSCPTKEGCVAGCICSQLSAPAFSTLKPRCRSPAALRAPGSLPSSLPRSIHRSDHGAPPQPRKIRIRTPEIQCSPSNASTVLARTCTLPTLCGGPVCL